MAGRKRIKAELEKIKALTFGEKAEYLWMYYKMWLLGALVIGVGIYVAVTMFLGMQENVVLNVAVVGGSNQETQELEQGFKTYAGINGKHDVVRVQANIPADGGAMASKTALTTLIGANAVDVMICPEDIYQEYEAQGGFINKLVMESNEYLKNVAGIPYEKAYICILINAQNKDMAMEFAKYLQSQ